MNKGFEVTGMNAKEGSEMSELLRSVQEMRG